MKKITSIAQLKQEIETKIKKAMEMTRDEIHNVVLTNVLRYYSEYKPKKYRRTNMLLDTMEKRPVEGGNGSYSFKVGWDGDYLEFTYPDTFNRHSHFTPTGLQVLEGFNSGLHGAIIDREAIGVYCGTNFWDRVINEIGGAVGIGNILKKNLAKVGLKQ